MGLGLLLHAAPVGETSWHCHPEECISVRISREEEVVLPDSLLSSLGFSDIVESVRGQYAVSLQRWAF